jgi:hypothetical protein
MAPPKASPICNLQLTLTQLRGSANLCPNSLARLLFFIILWRILDAPQKALLHFCYVGKELC